MKSNEKNYRLGELVTLLRKETLLKKSGTTSYAQLTGSRYICVREATDSQPGILVKVLGKLIPEHVMVVDGQPFSKDDRAEAFDSVCYFSYPFPTTENVKEVLEIIRGNRSLLQTFEENHMHINPNSKFWVSEVVSRLLVLRIPQCYDVFLDRVITPKDSDVPYRLSMIYF